MQFVPAQNLSSMDVMSFALPPPSDSVQGMHHHDSPPPPSLQGMHQAAEVFDPKTEIVYKYMQVGTAIGFFLLLRPSKGGWHAG